MTSGRPPGRIPGAVTGGDPGRQLARAAACGGGGCGVGTMKALGSLARPCIAAAAAV